MKDKASRDAAIRSAKKANRPSKIGVPEPRLKNSKELEKRKKKKKRERLSNIGFDKEIGVKGHRPSNNVQKREGTRARKGDAIGTGKKKGFKKSK